MSIDIQSVAPIIGGSKQIMVYGLHDCYYRNIQQALDQLTQEKGSPIQRLFTYQLALPHPFLPAMPHPELTEEYTHTLEKRRMNLITLEKSEIQNITAARTCKTALVDLVLENYKRKREGKDLIHCAFCLHTEKESDRARFKTDDMTLRDEEHNDKISHKELRRIYKLCFDPEVDERVRQVAKETFIFVNVSYRSGKFVLQPIDAPWKCEDSFRKLWETREGLRTLPKKRGENTWKAQLKKQVKDYDATFRAPVQPEPISSSNLNILSFFFLPLGILRLAGRLK